MRPLRKTVNKDSLMIMGVHKRFVNKSINDFNTYGKKSLKEVKNFVISYLKNIDTNIKDNKGICFMGSNGVGKSFLSSLILIEAYKHRYSCRRVSFSVYINAYTEGWGNKSRKEDLENELYEKYKGVEFLVLEEIGKEIDSKIAKPILEDLLRYREERGLVTIICTNLTPVMLKEEYGASVCSLINGNMTVVLIDSEDRRAEVFKKL